MKYASDIEIIRERSSTNVRALQAQSCLPAAEGLYISRAVAQTLRESCAREHVLIIGDAGSGKSAVAQELAISRLDTEEVVVFRAADVVGSNRLSTGAPLQEVLRGWPGPPGLIVIDGVDALRGSEDRDTLTYTVSSLAGTRWQIVATARSFDTRNSQPLQRAFTGEPVSTDASMVDARLLGVRHLLVGDLTDEELGREIVPPMPLASVLSSASSDLRALLRNPFNLRLAAEISNTITVSQQAELLKVRTRVELLNRYWDWRIRSSDKTAREALLKRLARTMVKGRRLQAVEAEPTVLGTDSPSLDALLSQGVLTALDGPIAGVGRVLQFSHNILFDYATAIYVLYQPLDPAQLVEQLDADPSLPLIARPSFDLLVEMMWPTRASRGFWELAFALAGSDHTLASLALVSRVVNLVRKADDLLAVVDSGGKTDSSGFSAGQRMTSHIIGAIRARTVLLDAPKAMLPLATLARRLASNGASSHIDAALATDLIVAMHPRVPSGEDPTAPGAIERASTMAALLDVCRSDPARLEGLAGALARLAKHFVGNSGEVRDAIQRLLTDDDALAQWGGTVLRWLPDAVVPTLSQDAQLARRMAARSVTFDENRDEDVALGSSAVMPLRESRKQQARSASYRLAEVFPEICTRDVVAATEIVCDVLAPSNSEGDVSKWPLSAHKQTGWLEHGYGFGLRSHGHVNERKILSALAAALPDQKGEDTAVAVVGLLASKIHDGWAWAALLKNPERPAELCEVFFPVLESGSLLAHPDTFPLAAGLLKAAAKEGILPRATIEAAVRNAMALADQNSRGEYVKDVLVGCLNKEAISDPSLAARLHALGHDVPEVPKPVGTIAEAEPWSPLDELFQDNAGSSTAVEQAARDLYRLLHLARNQKNATPEVVADLTAAVAKATEVFAGAEPLPSQLRYLLVDATKVLARDESVTPNSPEGSLVLKVLLEAADRPEAGAFNA